MRYFFSPRIMLLGLIALVAGCDRAADTLHPCYFRAEQCREAGDYEAAERQLRIFLKSRHDSADGHLAIASLYDENLHDLPRAIYHYREFIRLAPKSENCKLAQAWLADAEERLRTELNGKVAAAPEVKATAATPTPVTTAETETIPAEQTAKDNSVDTELAALRRQNQELKRRIFQQENQLRTLRSPRNSVAERPGDAPVPTAPPAVTGGKEIIYEVQSGDTLGRIARRFYGASSRFHIISKANNLPPNTRLRIGQKLRIPPFNQNEENK